MVFIFKIRFFNIFYLNAQFIISGWARTIQVERSSNQSLASLVLIRQIKYELIRDGRQILKIMKNIHLTSTPVG